jgi:serine/threonine-protein kinase
LSFGAYRVERTLAAGGTAEIVLATHSATGEQVALKRLLPELADSEQAVRSLGAEAELTASLSHPSIVRVVDRGEQLGEPFFAMEYVRGQTLLERGALGVDEVLALGRAVADALAHVHQRGVVHRDVCPENLMITESGRVVLLDFGVAFWDGDERSLPTGIALGTLAYASPEQLAGGALDGRADVFSLGVLLFELLTKRRLFRRDSDAATLLAVAEAEVPPLRRLRPDAPAELEETLGLALDRDPKRRPSAAELADRLTAR